MSQSSSNRNSGNRGYGNRSFGNRGFGNRGLDRDHGLEPASDFPHAQNYAQNHVPNHAPALDLDHALNGGSDHASSHAPGHVPGRDPAEFAGEARPRVAGRADLQDSPGSAGSPGRADTSSGYANLKPGSGSKPGHHARSPGSSLLLPSRRRTSVLTVIAWSLLPLLVLGCVAARTGIVLTYAFTPAALVVGTYFYLRSPANYVRLVVMMWVFSPFIRRIADYFSTYTESSPVLISAFLVSGLAGFCLFRREVFGSRYLAFAAAALGVVYGAVIGAALVHSGTVFTDGIRWTIPILFGLFCAVRGQEHPGLLGAILKTTMWSALVLGIYGLVQFVVAPPWDVFWLTNVQVGGEGTSFGSPVPFGIRLFSTASSPAVASCMLAAGFLIAVGSRSRWMYPIMIFTGSAIVLTMVRAEWVSLCVMLTVLFFRMARKERTDLSLRLAVCLGVLLVCLLPAMKSDWGEKIIERFSSFGAVKQDYSYRERSLGMARAWSMLPDQPFGKGVGYLDSPAFKRTPLYTIDGVGAHDIGALEVLFELGFIGALLYGAGMYLVGVRLVRTVLYGSGDRLVVAVLAFNTVLLFVSTNPLTSFEGVLFWVAGGFLLQSTAAANQLVDRGPAGTLRVTVFQPVLPGTASR